MREASIAFYVLSAIAVISALAVITVRNPVHSVLFLILTFFTSAGLFVLLGAWAFRGQKLDETRLILVLVGIVGALLVAQPGTGAVSAMAGLAFLTAISSASRTGW